MSTAAVAGPHAPDARLRTPHGRAALALAKLVVVSTPGGAFAQFPTTRPASPDHARGFVAELVRAGFVEDDALVLLEGR